MPLNASLAGIAQEEALEDLHILGGEAQSSEGHFGARGTLMSKYVVRQGDCIASIGARHGSTPEALLARSANSELRRLRPNPYVLAPGDIIDLPEAASTGVSIQSGGTKRFRAEIPIVHLRLRLLDASDEPAHGRRFEIVAGTHTIPGTTDGDGRLDVAVGALDAEATLRVWIEDGDAPIVLPLLLGHLDPGEEPSGIRHRLQNLGYPAGTSDESLASALSVFQTDQGMSPSGVLDDATSTRLFERHGT